MRDSGKCPKCEGRTIWNNLHIPKLKNRPIKEWIIVKWKGWAGLRRKFVLKDEYVCIRCGYSETYVNAEGLETIKELSYQEDR